MTITFDFYNKKKKDILDFLPMYFLNLNLFISYFGASETCLNIYYIVVIFSKERLSISRPFTNVYVLQYHLVLVRNYFSTRVLEKKYK